MKEFPSPSIETQNVVPTHPMPVNPWAEEMVTGALQAVPLKMVAWLALATATQYVALVQAK
jgi:hypothetical protein